MTPPTWHLSSRKCIAWTQTSNLGRRLFGNRERNFTGYHKWKPLVAKGFMELVGYVNRSSPKPQITW